jgi:predicted molibdopterin-dependent oxidoreductase YjgC
MDAWGIADGEFIKMASRRGEIQIKARLTERSPRGTVFTSFSFASVPVNILTGSGYGPVTQTTELKVCPVRLEKLKGRDCRDSGMAKRFERLPDEMLRLGEGRT